uniref:SUMF1/EgtB/PvdO family nonheme iron enzyme n=1 Tax=uncultured Draconibacterium sp. TaxID=1573823 RepID=UPI003216859C
MKKIFNTIMVLAASAIIMFSGCNKDDVLINNVDLAPVPLKMELAKNVIISGDSLTLQFSVEGAGDMVANKDIPITLSVSDESGQDASEYFLGFTETITFPLGEKVLTKTYQLTKLQMPKLNVTVNATSEGTTISNNSVALTISNNTLSKMLSFKIGDVEVAVEEGSTTVNLLMPTGTDLTNLEPVVGVSADASYEPQGPQDFTNSVKYTVTAQDGVTSLEYTVIVEVAKSTDASLESFILGGYVGIIDNDNSTVTVNVPVGTNTADLTPTVIPAFGASFQISGNTCVVTAEDGINTSNYAISFVEKAFVPKMVLVEGGTFTMGAGGDGGTFEATISRDLYVNIIEISWGQYSEVLGADRGAVCGWRFKPIGPDVAMQSVTFFDAVDFCNELSIMHGLDPYYDISGRVTKADGNLSDATVTIINPEGNGYRIPTEAEWEFIARGGNKSAGYTFPGSDVITEVGWVQENAIKTYNNWGSPFPGGLLKANELGVYDMCGNVREWCWDWFGDYPGLPTTDPTGPASGENKTTRGGQFWSKTTGETAVWMRGAPYAAGTSRYDIGIRVVRNK